VVVAGNPLEHCPRVFEATEDGVIEKLSNFGF
jgi:hypothetical protein